MATALLAQGAPVNAVDAEGLTALVHASGGGHCAATAVRLTAGATTGRTTTQGLTPLLIAAGAVPSCGHRWPREPCACLGEANPDKGVRVTSSGPSQPSKQWGAATEASEVVTALLLAAGANMDDVCHKQWTPLMHASWKGRTGVVLVLLGEAQRRGSLVNPAHALPPVVLNQKHAQTDFPSMAYHHCRKSGTRCHATKATARSTVRPPPFSPALRLCATPNTTSTRPASTFRCLFASSASPRCHQGLFRSAWGSHSQDSASPSPLARTWIDTADRAGNTALGLAACGGHLAVVRALLAAGAAADSRNRLGCTPLFLAAAGGHADVVSELIAAGATVDAASSAACGCRTALFWAAGRGHKDAVTVLLAAGASVRSRGTDGATALAYASRRAEGQAHPHILQQLLDAGSDPEARSHVGETALAVAARTGYVAAVLALAAAGANTNTLDVKGQPPLFTAIRAGRVDVIKALVAVGADLDFRQQVDGLTPLMLAAQCARAGPVRLLLAAGAPVLATARVGVTALHCSAEGGSAKVIERLLDAGASVDARTVLRVTPLMIAVEGGFVRAVESLVLGGADVYALGPGGQTAVDIAQRRGFKRVEQFLQSSHRKQEALHAAQLPLAPALEVVGTLEAALPPSGGAASADTMPPCMALYGSCFDQ
jgi:uncharacterized protein